MARIKLTNTKKREEFLATFMRWPIWAYMPELPLTVYRFDLPDGCAIVASKYASNRCGRAEQHPIGPYWQFLHPGWTFSPYHVASANVICGELLALGHIEVEVFDKDEAPGEAATSDQRKGDITTDTISTAR